jgi:hypothetical protein
MNMIDDVMERILTGKGENNDFITLNNYMYYCFTNEELDLIIWKFKELESVLGMDVSFLLWKAEQQKKFLKEREMEIEVVYYD